MCKMLVIVGLSGPRQGSVFASRDMIRQIVQISITTSVSTPGAVEPSTFLGLLKTVQI